MRKIRIDAGKAKLNGVLYENPTADAVWAALPFEAGANTWGAEIYFGIPVGLGQAEDARDRLEAGELGYWPPGKAFCIFFGKTPASLGDEIRAASAVNVFGRIEGDLKSLHHVEDGDRVTIARVEA
jgi:uncharacterized protein